jgi:ureidoacrylate peracid hydrolase
MRVKKDQLQRLHARLIGNRGSLKARGVDTVLITGTATNVCCESTAHDAMLLDYKVIMPSNGTTTWTEEEHAGTPNTFMMFFA